MENSSELRQDIVSGEWVTIATARAKRPQDFLFAPKKRFDQSKESCPFENPNEAILLDVQKESAHATKQTGEWFVRVVKNKFPAFAEGECSVLYKDGIYTKMEGAGHHEVVVTRDHNRSIADFTDEEAKLLMLAYKGRYLGLHTAPCVSYVFIFHNHGAESGATIAHPHSQIMALPVVSPDVQRSLVGSENYYRVNNRCVHCDVINFEIKSRVRVVHENEHALVVCPYASKTAFEMRIFPKRHASEFHTMDDDEYAGIGISLQIALQKLKRGLDDPSYNFFIHTAPTFDHTAYPHYHWHIEILPKTAIWAGFEIGTGIEISTIAPESAAAFLRDIE